MADVVDTIVLETTNRRYIARFTNVSDATGEAAVIKVDKSTLVASNGEEPRRLIVDAIKWSIQGFASVRLFFDHTTDDELAVLSGNGERSYWGEGGLKDPLSAGGAGDIVLTTNGAVTGATYDIVLNCRLAPTV
jgi:hypothetical protein